ncbi:AAA family ATPase [Pseudoalteromonas simplex]|uniref:AAA family ATPase n=1 Tax=Pseudoalteromonas simplex TaxID=2783613 RepID=UPI001888A5BC|nr:AAA family ATPase [Pseudoalteromonas sp. A520]|tara:strand:+ start:3112 stop:5358 length:2247 start_codon:yes stop_codon:yes gene_type:complete
MINSLEIANAATYGLTPQQVSPLEKFNFFFGANGAGKTTISRLIEDSTRYANCAVKWSGSPIETFVYNRDFVEKNFNPQKDLPGVFTLGEADQAIIDRIAQGKSELDKIVEEIKSKELILNGDENNKGKIKELEVIDNNFTDKCWLVKDKLDELFKDAFQGVRNSKSKFKERVVSESASNTADLKSKEYLIEKAKTLFGDTPESKPLISLTVDSSKLKELEQHQILKDRIIGKSDVDIAGVINKLNNSDWVRHGMNYLPQSEGECPFCQQSLLTGFEEQLANYFDETFTQNIESLKATVASYSSSSQQLISHLENLVANNHADIDNELLKAKFDTLKAIISENMQLLGNKVSEPASTVTLKATHQIIDEIRTIVENANNSINQHNLIVSNFKNEKELLSNQVWKYVLEEELKAEIQQYTKDSSSLQKAIQGLTVGINTKKADKIAKDAEIKELEKDTTSIQPTIDAINGLLKSFGFTSFTIGKSTKDRCYSIVRRDGSCAKETLSEGEKTFISFLYFYHLLKGSFSEVGITTDRVVVIDDPVSSLDSDILFIVSTLIKGLMSDARNDSSLMKQLFILTHNTYFFKEVTFNKKRSGQDKMRDETFWIVRKVDGTSKIVGHNSNPIKSSYELLWQEIKATEPCSLTIQNTMRKILENYFTFLGNIKKDDMIELFEGEERLICQSLFSWVNDGSHHAIDDLYVTQDIGVIDTYRKVFKKIFEASDHGAHYKMMTGVEGESDKSSKEQGVAA